MSTMHLLPFCKTPISTMYNNYSFALGIIQGNNENSFEPWAYGRYINCMINSEFGFQWGGGVLGPWKVNSDFIIFVNDDVKNLPHNKYVPNFVRKISEGYYIMGSINEYYIPATDAYGKWTYYHDTLLIGFDDEKKVFFAYTRLADQNMHLYELSYDDLEKAVLGKGSWYLLLKYTDNKITLDVEYIRAELSHYLYSSPSLGKRKRTKYGLQALEELCSNLTIQYRERRYIDYRYTRGLFEQKKIMHNMCKYLNDNGYNLPDEVLKLSKDAADAASIIHMLSLKTLMYSKYNGNVCKRLSAQFDRIVECESTYIPIMMHCLMK